MNSIRCFACRLSAVALAAAGFASPAARAQDASTDALSLPGSEVPVLTPTRMRQAVRDMPASVTILSAETLALYGFQGLAEAMRLVSGASPDRLAGANYSLQRGGKSALGPGRVTLLVDGIELGGTVLSDDDDWNDLPVALNDIERIEVTSGAGAAGYGRASKVAVVNFVTKHPADVERGYGFISVGSFEALRAMARGGWTLGPAALRLTVHHRERNDIQDRRAFTPGDDAVSVDRVTLRTAIAIAEGSSLAFDAAYLSSDYVGEPAARHPLGPREFRNGYASALWTQSVASSNELSLRLDQWANTSREFQAECLPGVDCDPDVNVERRTKLELQDVHVVSDSLRIAGGVGLRQALMHSRGEEVARWSARYRRTFAEVDWAPLPALSLGVGASADEADSENHDRTWHAGANWHLDNEQTVRLAWSAGDWASDQGLRLGLSGVLLTEERIRSTELGYLLEDPARGASVNARIFWSRLNGQVWGRKTGDDQPAHGEFYGVELRVAGELSERWSGFVSATTLAEGDHSGLSEGHRPHPWIGAVGLALKLDDGWRASLGYYASSKSTTSTQTAGRTALTLLKDLRLFDARSQLSLNLRNADHLRAPTADGTETPHTATAWSFFVSLSAAF
ncbi:MAG TPA: TonB-dependent receptor [Ideonella sp.]|nr:TonB-dependent receptor [Ideonella sp.]